MRFPLLSTLVLPLLLTGCNLSRTDVSAPATGVTLQGRVHGGQQPIAGAHVYLFAANTTGYGAASVSLLNAAITLNSDSIGAYVLSGPDGGFTITGDYTCTPGQQVYLYALGGNPGAGINNASGLLAVLGNCPASGNFLAATPFVWINEVSTIAGAYAMAGFAVDATHVSSSGTPLAVQGIANAFANAANLADLSTGVALTTTPSGAAAVPQTVINTLANILATCINSDGDVLGPTNPTACYTLFLNAQSEGSSGNVPTDTATAAINLAHNPSANVETLYALQLALANPFQPALPSQANDFSVGLNFSGGSLNGSVGIAIDAVGNAWIAGDTVTVLSSSGAFASGSTGYKGGGLNDPQGIAIDTLGNAWVANYNGNSVIKISSSGTFLSGSSGYTGPSLDFPKAIAVDATDNIWVTSQFNSSVEELSNSGSFLTNSNGGYTGGGLAYPYGIAIDTAKNVWVGNFFDSKVTEISGTGTFVTGSTGYTGSGLDGSYAVAIDASGNVWVTNYYGASVTELSSALSPIGDYTGGGLRGSDGIAIDGDGNAWVSNLASSSISEISSAGDVLTGSTGLIAGGLSSPNGIAVDGSGNVWVANGYNSVVELIGAAAPVVTPIAAGVANNALGTRP